MRNEKNYTKYESYRFAFDQIDRAIKDGYFLEAITIEESILADRLISFLQLKGISANERFTLGKCLIAVKNLDGDFSYKEFADFRGNLKSWWDQRNACIHAIVKSKRGDPTIQVGKFLELAEETAIQGKTLSRKVSDWLKREKRIL